MHKHVRLPFKSKDKLNPVSSLSVLKRPSPICLKINKYIHEMRFLKQAVEQVDSNVNYDFLKTNMSGSWVPIESPHPAI